MTIFVFIAAGSLLAAGVALLVIRQHEDSVRREKVTRPIEDPKRLTRKKSRR